MKKIKLNLLILTASGVLSILMMDGCQPTPPPLPPAPPANPISCAFNPPGGISCTGATVKFNAMAPVGSKLKIVGVAAIATGPNADCATATVAGDVDNRPEVIDTGVIVSCDCGQDQTVHVVITVVDQNGNVCDAICTLTTP